MNSKLLGQHAQDLGKFKPAKPEQGEVRKVRVVIGYGQMLGREE